METLQPREFGKRGAAAALHTEPVKRSHHVALLLMGTLAVGGSAYALIPKENCEPKGAGMASPSLPQAGAECSPRRSSSTSHVGYSGAWSAVIISEAILHRIARHLPPRPNPVRAR